MIRRRRRRGGPILTVPFDFFVDSVNGNDANTGTNRDEPFQTLSALTAHLENSVRIGLKRGSYWEETLDVASYNDVLVDDYGDSTDPMPRIDSTGVATNGDFSLADTTTNVYEIAWDHDLDPTNTGAKMFVWEDGDALPFATSLANCDATAGSFWYSGEPEASDPLTVYVHPKGSTVPASDGKEYRLTMRANVLRIGLRATIRDLYLDKAGVEGGLIVGGGGSNAALGATIERCILRWGNKHHFVMPADEGYHSQFNGVIAYKRIPGPNDTWGGGSHEFTINRDAPTGGSWTYDGCVIYNQALRGGGFFSHVNTSGGWDSETIRNCYIYGPANASINTPPVDTPLYQDNYIENAGGFAVWRDTTIEGFTYIYPSGSTHTSKRAISLSSAGSGGTFSDGAIHAGKEFSGGAVWGSTTNEYTVTLSNFSIVGATSNAPGIYSDDAETVVQLSNSIISGTRMFGLVPEITADLNVYYRPGSPGNAQYRENGVTYTGLAAWQTASDEDANSTEADPQWAGTTAEGDFSLDPASPAFTGGRNAGARRWRTQPDWAALMAMWDTYFYAHPTDAVGGSELVVRA